MMFLLVRSSALQLFKNAAPAFPVVSNSRWSRIFLHLGDDQFQLFVFGVEMRRDAHAGAGPVINNEFSPDQFFGDRRRIVIPNCNRAAAPGRIARTGYAKARCFGQLD